MPASCRSPAIAGDTIDAAIRPPGGHYVDSDTWLRRSARPRRLVVAGMVWMARGAERPAAGRSRRRWARPPTGSCRCVRRLVNMSSSIDMTAAVPASVAAHPETVARYLVSAVPTARPERHAGDVREMLAGGRYDDASHVFVVADDGRLAGVTPIAESPRRFWIDADVGADAACELSCRDARYRPRGCGKRGDPAGSPRSPCAIATDVSSVPFRRPP